MKNIIIFAILISTLYLVSFTNKVNLEQKHLMISDTNVVDLIPVKVTCKADTVGFYVINNEQEYKNILTNCSDYTLPTIDYGHYTLIGIHRNSGGCSARDTSFAIQIDNEIIVNNTITTYGLCAPMRWFTHWYLIKNVSKSQVKRVFKTKQVY